jgi:hypothetical protein
MLAALAMGVLVWPATGLRAQSAPVTQRSGAAQKQAEIGDINGVDQLKALFNQDAGKYRLVVLASPT